ncbi:MAG: hypothetical protein QM703_14075 [Gemmatales bacterium]
MTFRLYTQPYQSISKHSNQMFMVHHDAVYYTLISSILDFDSRLITKFDNEPGIR